MNQQPDKLFREKLEGFQLTPPPAAWEKIETNLSKKNNKFFWLKVAASIALVLTLSYLLWPSGNDSVGNLTASNQNTTPTSASNKDSLEHKANDSVTKQDVAPLPQEEQNLSENLDTKNPKPAKTIKPSEKRQVKKSDSAPQKNEQQKELLAETNATDENNEQLTSVEPVIAKVEEQQQPASTVENNTMKITLTAEEVNEKYLTKKSIAEATTDEKKSSTLRKLLDKAYDLKHNQDPVGELRQMKNEILALNFKNDKQQRRQNNK